MLRLPSNAIFRPAALTSSDNSCDSRQTCSESSRRRELSDVVDVDEDILLGKGGFGRVHLGWLHGSSRWCAVKIVPKDYLVTPTAALHEADIVRSLSHHCICQLLDVLEDEENVYLVLERIEGNELFDEICPNQGMSEPRAIEILRQVMEALQYCHTLDNPIVHRDLKPENIMVQKELCSTKVKLIDFGLAAHDGHSDGAVGTLSYVAPEAAGSCACHTSQDMWSMGVVMHTLLVGKLPPPAVRAGLEPLDTSGTSWSGISYLAKDLLSRLVCVEQQRRITAAEALLHPWFSPDVSLVLGSPMHTASSFPKCLEVQVSATRCDSFASVDDSASTRVPSTGSLDGQYRH